MSLLRVEKILNELRNEIAHLDNLKQEYEPIPLERLGERVVAYRNEHKYSQEYFSDIIGVSKTVLVSVEKNRKTVTLQNLLKITDAIGVKICLR